MIPSSCSVCNFQLHQEVLQLKNSLNALGQCYSSDDRVVVQDVRGRYNANNQGRPFQRNNESGIRECPQPKRPQDSDYFKDKMLLMNAHKNGVVLDKEQLLFLAGSTGSPILITDVDDLANSNVDMSLKLIAMGAFDSDYHRMRIMKYHEMQSDVCGRQRRVYKVETSLKSELHSAQLQLRSTLNHHKIMREEAIILKLCQPKSFYDEKHKVAIGYKRQAQSAVCNGHMPVTTNRTPTVIHDSEDTRELAEITRNKMLLKMQSPLCVKKKIPISVHDYAKENLLATFAHQRHLTPEQIFWSTQEQIFWSIDDNNRKKAETLAPKPISALTVYPPNTPVKLVPRILPTKSQVKINLYVLTQLFTEFDKMTKLAKTESPHQVPTEGWKEKNLLIENENLIANWLSNQLLYDVEKSRCLDLEAEMSKVHNESKHISKLEREYLNLQLKYQHLQESFDNKKSQTSQEAPDFNSFFKIKNLEHQIQEKDNVIRDLKVLVANVNDRSCVTYNAKDVTALIEQNDCVRVELEKVKQHYKELYDSIKITRAHTSEKTSTMLNEIESLKAQLRSKESCFTSDSVKPKVLAPGMYAIDVKPIPHPLKNNRSAHLNYISHLKESVETVREIVEEARVVKPLDNALNYACQYTKLSQELLEYVIGTCPKSFNERDNKAPSTPVTRKKQVTFSDKPGTSSSNTQKHEVHQKVQQTNIPVIPSTGVNTSTEASGSKPRSNTKKNRILPAKRENKKKVEDHLRTNKSVWTKVNRVDSSISSKRVVINSNSESVCKTCNKCLNSANHEMCVVNILSSVNATPTVKIVLNKGKQIWKPKGKLSDNSLNKTKQIWQPKGKLSDNSLNKTKQVWKATGKLFANVGYQWRPTGKKFALGELCPLTRLPVTCGTDHPLVSGLRLFKTRFRGMNGSLVISSILRGGTGHNLFSIGQFCDSDLEVAFRKHSCFVSDINGGKNLLKVFESKDETPEYVINFLKQIQVGLNKTVRYIRTDNGTEFVNQVMSKYYEGVGIFHQKSVPRTPQQNGVVERRNHTLVEAARTMMIFSKAPMFLWAEAVATACYTQNRSLIHTRHNKTPYELVHDKKPDLTFLRVFGALCYPTNDSEDLGKFQAKADIGIFVGYAPSRKGYRIYNKRTRRLMETIHVTFDEMHQTMAPVRMSSGPEPIIMTPGQLKSGLAPTDKELEMLFQPMFDEYLEQSRVNEPVPSATEVNAQVVPPGTSLSTTIAQDAPSTSASSSTSDMHHPVRHQGIAEEPTLEDSPITHDVLHPSFNPVTGEPGSAQSSSGNVNLTEPNQVTQPPDHLRK
ncbi:integrase, catalytic region, zinc finger, CCHC-type containing protein [Tanacetum coccineum]